MIIHALVMVSMLQRVRNCRFIITANGASSCVCRSKLSSGSHNGFDFTQFQSYFDAHRRQRAAAEQLHELRRRTLTVTSDMSLDSAPSHAATTNTCQCWLSTIHRDMCLVFHGWWWEFTLLLLQNMAKLCDMSSRVTGRALRITEAEMAKWRGPYGTSCLLYPHSSPFENKLLVLQVDFVRLESVLLGRIACTVVQMYCGLLVCMSLLDTTLCPTKPDEPIEMLFLLRTRVRYSLKTPKIACPQGDRQF